MHSVFLCGARRDHRAPRGQARNKSVQHKGAWRANWRALGIRIPTLLVVWYCRTPFVGYATFGRRRRSESARVGTTNRRVAASTMRKAAQRAASPRRAVSPGRRQQQQEGKAADPRMTKKRRRQLAAAAEHDGDEGEYDDEDAAMPAALQRKIAAQARMQQSEVEANEALEQARFERPAGRGRATSRRGGGNDDSGDSEDEDGGAGAAGDDVDDAAELEGAGEFYEDVEELELGEDDERALNLLMGGSGPARTLGDVIMAKIEEREAHAAALARGEAPVSQEPEGGEAELPEKVRAASVPRAGTLPSCPSPASCASIRHVRRAMRVEWCRCGHALGGVAGARGLPLRRQDVVHVPLGQAAKGFQDRAALGQLGGGPLRHGSG